MDAAFSDEDDLNDGMMNVWHEVLAVLAGLWSGVKYGVKIRLPHALVMTFMFRRDLSMHGKLRVVVKAVWEHAKSLGSFALIYKASLLSLKLLHRNSLSMRENSAAVHTLGRFLMKMLGEAQLYALFFHVLL